MRLSYGWFAAGIGDFIRENGPVFSELPVVVLAAIDSSNVVSSMPFARFRSEKLEAPNGIFAMSGSGLVELAFEKETFFGFDEIWIPLRLSALPGAWPASLRCPLNLEQEELPKEIFDWATKTEIRLALGDGYGTNFVGFDQVLIARLGLTPNF